MPASDINTVGRTESLELVWHKQHFTSLTTDPAMSEFSEDNDNAKLNAKIASSVSPMTTQQSLLSDMSPSAAALERSMQEAPRVDQALQTRAASLRARISEGQLIREDSSGSRTRVLGFTDFTTVTETPGEAISRDQSIGPGRARLWHGSLRETRAPTRIVRGISPPVPDKLVDAAAETPEQHELDSIFESVESSKHLSSLEAIEESPGEMLKPTADFRTKRLSATNSGHGELGPTLKIFKSAEKIIMGEGSQDGNRPAPNPEVGAGNPRVFPPRTSSLRSTLASTIASGTSNPMALAMSLLNSAQAENPGPQRDHRLHLATVLVSSITHAQEAQTAAEEAKQAARRAEMAAARSREDLIAAANIVDRSWNQSI